MSQYKTHRVEGEQNEVSATQLQEEAFALLQMMQLKGGYAKQSKPTKSLLGCKGEISCCEIITGKLRCSSNHLST